MVNALFLISFFLLEVTGQDLTKCGMPRDYPHSQLRDTSRREEVYYSGDRAYYDCAVGYTPERGSRRVECRNGEWTQLTLICARKSCGSAGEILNGHFEYEGDALFGDKAVAVCDNGHHLKGAQYLQCGDVGWEGEVPVCVLMPEGWEIICPSPSVKNGFSSGGDDSMYRPNDVVTFTCQEGFRMNGSRQSVCGADGQWRPPPPQCSPQVPKEVTCPHPSVASGVKMSVHRPRYRTGDVINFTCAEGFVLSGSEQTVCESDGRWNSQPPHCLHSNGSCGAPPTYPNMHPVGRHVSQHVFHPQSQIYYKCALGYIRSRGSTFISRCVDGKWTYITMRCERKICGSLPEILHGHYQYEGIMFGDRATAVCDKGYQIVGGNSRQCHNTGWDGRDPVCEAMQCSDPPKVTGGEWTGPMDDRFVYMTVIRYSCLHGQLIGERDIICTHNGTWSPTPPQCKDIRCPNPKVNNAEKMSGFGLEYRYKDMVAFSCNRGYKMTGARRVTCDIDGKWSPPLPECKSEQGHCGPPPQYPNMFPVPQGSKLKYKCSPGYKASRGNSVSQCLNGRWSYITTRCQHGFCPNPKVENARIIDGLRQVYAYKDYAVFQCNKGYELNGSRAVHCNEELKWQPALPKCIKSLSSRSRFPRSHTHTVWQR